MNLNLKEMTIEELQALLVEVRREIESRQEKPELVIYTHDCKNSARHHRNKYKHWAKLVTGIDTSKTSGYAWQGEFLSVHAEHKVPIGSVIVEVCDNTITAYEMTADGKSKIDSARTNSQSALIDLIAKKYF